MKTKLTLVFIALFCSLQINAQTKQEVFTGIQKLVDKASGEKVKSNDVFSKKDDKLGKQFFTEKEITVSTIPGGKSDYEWISRATEMSWNDFFDFLIFSEYINNNLQIVRLNFNKPFKTEHFTNDETSGAYPSTSNRFEFYILTKDKNELTQLLNRIYDLKEKKPESQFNQEISKFSNEQTISWLTEKLQNNMAGDSYTTSIKLISIDACNLVFDYSNFVGRKYRETIPTAIESISKYNEFTYNKKICISKSFAFGMIQEHDETTYQDKSFLSINTKDEDLISNIAFAMKHLASYCNSAQVKVSAKPVTESIKKSNIDLPTNTDVKTSTKPLVENVKKENMDVPTKMTEDDLAYIKEFFVINFVKIPVSIKGYEDVKQYDYEIRSDAIIIYTKGITNNQDNQRNRYQWYYLPIKEIQILDINNTTQIFKNEDVLRLGLINKKWIPHGQEKKFIKLENTKYSTPTVTIPLLNNNREDWEKVKLIFNKYHIYK